MMARGVEIEKDVNRCIEDGDEGRSDRVECVSAREYPIEVPMVTLPILVGGVGTT